jgi:hypothetical protein
LSPEITIPPIVDGFLIEKIFLMATPLDPNQVVTFEELLMSQVIQQEALTRLLVEKRSIH